MSDDNGTELYISQRNEHVKQYVELDAQGRPYKVYTASLKVPVNGPCEITSYGFDGNSTTVIARKEGKAVWLQAYQDAVDSI